jgi:hypothetical protein|tara:strand:- start:12060 stop:12638 length:579 start_codon:yes stop_codon:yes gene_type:complete
MAKHETPLWISIIAVLACVLFIAVAAHDMFEAPEVVIETETITETIVEYVDVECPVVEEVVCEECAICPVVDEDLQEEQDVRESMIVYIDELIADEDFIEDELIPTIESEYNCTLYDEDDLLEVEVEDYDVNWDVDDEEGNYEVEIETKFYCDDSRDDYKVRDMLLSGEFDEDTLEDLEDGDDLEDYLLADA